MVQVFSRLATDDNRNLVSDITYHPFGESNTKEGSEDYLFTGKERDSTGLYYYGARYYDPGIGRFITRDLHSGRLANPQTLTRYTYCANNPLKYIDPDGHDYFKPEWARHDSPYDVDVTSEGLSAWMTMWFSENFTKTMAGYANWKEQNEGGNVLLAAIVSGAGGNISGYYAMVALGTIAGGIIGFVVGVALAYIIYLIGEAAEFFLELWTICPTFSDLFAVAKYYSDAIYYSADCEQEFADAIVELLVYMLQEKFGSDWRNYCNPQIVAYYDEMMKRKQSLTGNNDDQQENSKSTSVKQGKGSSIIIM